MIKYEAVALGGWVLYDIEQLHDVWVFSGIQNVQDFDLASDFGLFDWFEDLYDEPTVVGDADARVYLRVLAFADFGDDFVLFDIADLEMGCYPT